MRHRAYQPRPDKGVRTAHVNGPSGPGGVVLRFVTMPVMVANPSVGSEDGAVSGSLGRPAPAHRILLAVEPGTSSDRAIEIAISMAVHDGAELIVLSVAEPYRPLLPGSRPHRLDQEHERLEHLVAGVVTHARASGVRATWLVWDGDPAETISDAALAEGADLIVMGSHKRGPVTRRLLGSVSRQVIDQASCRVVVVPAH